MHLSIPMLELSFAIAVTVGLAGGAVAGFINGIVYLTGNYPKGRYPFSLVFIPLYLLWMMYIT